MNYYVQSEEKPTVSEPRYTPRILGRRFALTSTAYKYLEIGISAGPMSYVELLLGDTRGNQIILPYIMWKALIERRMDIERLVQSTVKSSVSIYDLVIQIVKMRKENVVKFSLHDTCIYMKPSTVLFMLDLEHCVEHIYYWLCQNTYSVSDKFKQFVNYLRENCINNKNDAVKSLRDYYDKTSFIDCELIAYAIDNIVHAALHEI